MCRSEVVGSRLPFRAGVLRSQESVDLGPPGYGSDHGCRARVPEAASSLRLGASCLVASYAGALDGYAGAGSSVQTPSWIDADVISGGAAPTSQTLPTSPGQCVSTRIAEVHPRLGGDGPVKSEDFDAGTAVEFDNGGHQVSYNREQALLTSHPGDSVIMCLIAIPQACPQGDDRGRSYLVTNTRTRQTWELPDSQHMCGGA